ncbi:MAG: FHA domain-containing protein [Deltaproteobacteria bacterium]|nr:MAG: FHA domain-containing protein [Deltaproteobacteria bacterium]
MPAYPELVLRIPGGRQERSVAIGTRHLSLGRGPDNDVVLPSPQVSRHHAILWYAGGQVLVRDLGSANGTFLDGERVTDSVAVPYGAELRLGSEVRLTVRPPVEPVAVGELKAFALEDIATGMRRPLHGDRFVIGSGPGADLRLASGPEVGATLLVYPGGEVWLGTEDDDDRPLQAGAEFEVAGSRFRLVEVDPTRLPTVQPDHHRYPYRLRVSLDGPAGTLAEISHLSTRLSHSITAENRVVLLYLLARRIDEDGGSGLPESERGWCADDDVIVGVWGRSALGQGGNRLKVLVHRVRKELKSGGFDPWCIEKRSGFIRGRFAEVVLD